MLQALPHARKPAVAAALLAAVLLSACAPMTYLRETEAVDTTAAFQITDRSVVEPIDLGWLLLRYSPQSPHAEGCRKHAETVPRFARGDARGTESDEERAINADIARLDRSSAYFACIAFRSPDLAVQARNALQERLLVSSHQRCNAFKSNLQRQFSRTNFGLGVLTTVAGTAGALVSGNSVAAARNWAGTAAALSGARAEFNQDFMNNLAAHVIVEGVEKRRDTLYAQIRQRQLQSYAAYSVEAAIKDAIHYHGQCSVVAGFQQAADAIKTANNPGLNQALQIAAQVRGANALLSDDKLAPDLRVKRMAELGTFVAPPAPLTPSDGGVPAFTKIRQTMGLVAAKTAELRAQLEADSVAKPATVAKAIVDGLDKARNGLKGDPLTDAGLIPSCLSVGARLASEQLKLQAEIDQASGDAREKKELALDTLRRQADTVALTLHAIAEQFVAAADRAMTVRAKHRDGAFKGDAMAQAAYLAELEVGLSPALVAQAKPLCPNAAS